MRNKLFNGYKLSLLFLLLITFILPSYARTLEVGWELWFPYQYRNKAQQLVGLDIDVFKAIIKQANLQANYVELPWKRHLRYIKSGEMDVAFGASYTEDRAKYAYFTIPYRTENVKIFVNTNSTIKLNKLSDLTTSKLLIGTEVGYYYGEEFAKLYQKPTFKKHINEVLDIEQNISMLLKGRIDGLLADPNTVTAFCKKYKIENTLKALPLNVYQTQIYIMLSKKSVDKVTLEKMNNAITSLKQNGRLDKILAKWKLSL